MGRQTIYRLRRHLGRTGPTHTAVYPRVRVYVRVERSAAWPAWEMLLASRERIGRGKAVGAPALRPGLDCLRRGRKACRTPRGRCTGQLHVRPRGPQKTQVGGLLSVCRLQNAFRYSQSRLLWLQETDSTQLLRQKKRGWWWWI